MWNAFAASGVAGPPQRWDRGEYKCVSFDVLSLVFAIDARTSTDTRASTNSLCLVKTNHY